MLAIFDGFAYNKAISVNLWNQQTDHSLLKLMCKHVPVLQMSQHDTKVQKKERKKTSLWIR